MQFTAPLPFGTSRVLNPFLLFLPVFVEESPAKRIREFHSVGDNPPTIELEHVEQLDQGPSYDELTQDAVLAQSELLRFNNQGTLFALTEAEAEYRLGRLCGVGRDRRPHEP